MPNARFRKMAKISGGSDRDGVLLSSHRQDDSDPTAYVVTPDDGPPYDQQAYAWVLTDLVAFESDAGLVSLKIGDRVTDDQSGSVAGTTVGVGIEADFPPATLTTFSAIEAGSAPDYPEAGDSTAEGQIGLTSGSVTGATQPLLPGRAARCRQIWPSRTATRRSRGIRGPVHRGDGRQADHNRKVQDARLTLKTKFRHLW
jgi:hypothetical protein